MIVRIRTSIRWVCMVLVVGLSMSWASEHESIVEEVFTIQRHQLLSVRTIDMPYSEKIEYSEHLRNLGVDYASVGDRFSVNRFRMEGGKFRADSHLDGSVHKPDGIGPRTYAFDMKNLQIYNKRQMNLYVPKLGFGSMDKGNIPYQNTYKWVFRDQRKFSFSGFQDKSAWDGLKRRVRHVESSKVQGHDCVLIEFDYSERNQYSRIYFAKDLDYFPIKVEIFEGGTRVLDHVVTRTEKVETPEGAVFVPMETFEKHWESDFGNLLFTITHSIDKEQLSVNKDIPDEVFTIPLHMVRSYTNMLDKDSSFYIDRSIDRSLEDIVEHNPIGVEQSKRQTTEGGDSVLVEHADDDDYQEPTDVLASDIGARGSIVKICGIVILVLAVFAGLLFVRLRRRRQRTT